MNKNIVYAALVITAVILALWYLLGSRPSAPRTPTQVAPTPTTSEPSSATDGAIMKEEKNVVKISSSGFLPKDITIKVGEEVTWVNEDSSDHQVNSAVHPTHQVYTPLNTVGLLKSGEKKSLSFPEAGTYKYHNHLNPTLIGSVTVE